jgi:hypothetical protein
MLGMHIGDYSLINTFNKSLTAISDKSRDMETSPSSVLLHTTSKDTMIDGHDDRQVVVLPTVIKEVENERLKMNKTVQPTPRRLN